MKRKTIVISNFPEDLHQAMKVEAAKQGKHDYEVYEAAAKAYLEAKK